MELRQHRNDREVDQELDREREVEEPKRWPGKHTRTETQGPVDTRLPDVRRVRAALGALRTGGKPLPGAMTAEYSKLLGLDLADVRLHHGGAAGDAAKSLGATAFTAGTNIAVADSLDLDSAFGRHVLAHELVHVAQNKRGGGEMDLAARMEVGPSGSAVELEAERGAAALTSGQTFAVGSHGRLPGISLYGGNEGEPSQTAPQVPVQGANPPPAQSQQPAPAQQQAPAQTPPPPAQAQQPAQTPAPASHPTPAQTPGGAQPGGTANPANTAPARGPSSGAPAPAGTSTPARPTPSPSPAPRGDLDNLVKEEIEKRADPKLKTDYSKAVAGVDSLRIQALQFAFQPNGVWNTIVETFTSKTPFQDHAGQIYSANAYRGGRSWADTAQAWIEGLRGVVHIVGDIAAVVAAWAGLAAIVTGALALVFSETVIGGIALGAIAAIAAEVATVAGAIKLLTDIIDFLLGIIQMIILIVRARNSKDPGERARFAQLLRKEANDFGANLVSIGVQVAVMAASAGVAAGLSKGASSFTEEFTKLLKPVAFPRAAIKNILALTRTVAPGAGVAARGKDIFGNTVARRVLQVEVEQGLVGISALQRNALGQVTRNRTIIPFTVANQMRGARLVTMRAVVKTAFAVNTGGFTIGLVGGQLQSEIKQPRGDRGGTASTGPSAQSNRSLGPGSARGASDFSTVQMWPSQVEMFESSKGPLSGAISRSQRQYELAEEAAGPQLSAQVRQAFGSVNNAAGEARFQALAIKADAAEGQANTQRGLQQTGQGKDGQNRMGQQQAAGNQSMQKIQGEGGKLQSPPPKEGVLGWLYNQTIGRIGKWIGDAQKWVTNLVGKWAMSLAGFSKEEMDIAGVENDMREDDKKDTSSTQEAQDAALKADQIQQTVFQLQENRTRDEQAAIQGMADAQRFIMALEDAEHRLEEAITSGQNYIQQVTPIIKHEMETEDQGQAIDAPYVAPVAAYATAFTNSIASSNISGRARGDAGGELSQMKATYPDLDIGQGQSAITREIGQYETAFEQLAGAARAQAGQVANVMQAFIGTQDYEGVQANARALDKLAADFDRAAQGLADQLYVGLNAIITQYNAHIQAAIDAANAQPDDADAPADDPAASSTAAPTPSPAPAPTPTPTVPQAAPTGTAQPQAVQRKAIDNTAPTTAQAPTAAPAGDTQATQADQPQTAAPDASATTTTPTATTATAADQPSNVAGPAGGASSTNASPGGQQANTKTDSQPKPTAGAQQPGAQPAQKGAATTETQPEQTINNQAASENPAQATTATPTQQPSQSVAQAAQSAASGASAPKQSAQAITTKPTAAAPNSAASTSPAPKQSAQGVNNTAAPGGGGGAQAVDAPASFPEGGASTAPEPKVKNNEADEHREQKKADQTEDIGGDSSSSAASSFQSSHSVQPSGELDEDEIEADQHHGDSDVSSDQPSGALDSSTRDQLSVQRRGVADSTASSPVDVATRATSGAGGSLPFVSQIQQSFGHHDVSGIRYHDGAAAAEGASALGAKAFAVGDAVAFNGAADLHTAAHEAAHVVQQRAGIRPAGGMDTGASDPLEQHADRVADAVVAGKSAAPILDALVRGGGTGGTGVQRRGEIPTIKVKTEPLSADGGGGGEARTTVGVGEIVEFTGSAAGTWSVSGGKQLSVEAEKLTWQAPGTPGQFSIKLKVDDKESAPQGMGVIAPTGIRGTRQFGYQPTQANMLGAGMEIEKVVLPLSVNFKGMTVQEQGGGATGVTGYFKGVASDGRADLTHNPGGKGADGKVKAPADTEVDGQNRLIYDDDCHLMDSASEPWPRPIHVGSMTWQVPHFYTAAGTRQSFTIVSQTMGIVDSAGTVMVTKAGAQFSRTPAQPVWNPPAKGDTKGDPGTDEREKASKEEAAAADRKVGVKPEPEKKAAGYGTSGGEGYATQGKALGRASNSENPLPHDKLSAPPAATPKLTSHTEAIAADGPEDRTTVGVGEKVKFTSDTDGAWTATEVGPGGVKETKKDSKKYSWVAPATAGSVTITVTTKDGGSQSMTMTVIAPTVDYKFPKDLNYAAGKQGAGMETQVRFEPYSVSFINCMWLEVPGPASNIKGYFSTHTPPYHHPNEKWLPINDEMNGGPVDTAAFWGFKSPWTDGSFDWVIPTKYKLKKESGDGHLITDVTQSCVMSSTPEAGTTTVTKGTSSVTRSPSKAPPKKKKKGGSGKGRQASWSSGQGRGNARESADSEGELT